MNQFKTLETKQLWSRYSEYMDEKALPFFREALENLDKSPDQSDRKVQAAMIEAGIKHQMQERGIE